MTFELLACAAMTLALAAGTLAIGIREPWAAAAVHSAVFLAGLPLALRAARRPATVRWSWPLTLLALAPAWGLAQLAAGSAVYPQATMRGVLHWLGLWVIAAAIAQVGGETETRRRFLQWFLVFGLAVAASTLLPPAASAARLITAISSACGDFFGPFQNRNNYASFALLLAPVACWQALTDRRRAWFWWSAAALIPATVVVSGSRAGSLLIAIEVLTCFAIGWRRRLAARRTLAAGAMQVALLGVVFTVIGGWGLLWQRIQIEDLFLHRRDILRSTVAMAVKRPWMGHGLGAFEAAYPRFARFDAGLVVNYAHNDWLQWGAEGGWPFLAMLAAVAVWSLPRAAASLWGLGLIFVYVHALVDFPMQRMGVTGWVFAMVGALAASTGQPQVSKTSPRQPLGVEGITAVQQQRRAHRAR